MQLPTFQRAINLLPGEVWLVGAGPGDPGLLTLGGWQALQQADVVVHDRLGCADIISQLPEHIRLINVGKTPGISLAPGQKPGHEAGLQDAILTILLSEARAGARVVRLKGGDPYVFGRGREEMDFLAEHGIPCHMIPGVTSALSGPAVAGIPVTYRGEARSVLIATGHTMEGAIASIRRPDTLVFLMAVKNSPPLTEELLKEGYDGNTPVAIIENASLPDQRTTVCTLFTLPQTIEQNDVKPPALIVIGAVARFGNQVV